MDGRARWYRLRICRSASYPQHSRSASFDAGGGSEPTSEFHGEGHDNGGDDGGGTGRRRTTPTGHTTTRAPTGGGRVATALHSTTEVVLRLLLLFAVCGQSPMRSNISVGFSLNLH